MWLRVYDSMKTCGYVFMAAGLNEDMWDACRVCPPLKGTVPWESPELEGWRLEAVCHTATPPSLSCQTLSGVHSRDH